MANPNIDLNEWFEKAQEQFRGLNPNEPGQWPLLPKIAIDYTVAEPAAAAISSIRAPRFPLARPMSAARERPDPLESSLALTLAPAMARESSPRFQMPSFERLLVLSFLPKASTPQVWYSWRPAKSRPSKQTSQT